jgi:hypothetical protein
VDDRRSQIENALREYGASSEFASDYRYFLFSQPELLVLWERIETAPLALLHTIRHHELLDPVKVLAEVIGYPLDVE